MLTPRRKHIRLSGYDYSAEGGYFVTVVTHGREPLFGEVVDGEVVLSEFGKIVENTWLDLVNHNGNIGLDEFVVMPNHIHGIIMIFEPVGAGSPAPTGDAVGADEPAPTRNVSLSEIVRQLKTFSARRINTLRGTPGTPVWQRNYYDHIIRSDREYEEIAAYIANNPSNWLTDTERLPEA